MRIVGDECQCGKKDVPGPPHVDLVYQVRQFYDKSRKTIIVEEIPRSDVENTKRSVTDSGEAMIVVDYFANCAAAEEFAELCWNDGILPIRTNGMRSGTKKKPKVLGLSDTLMELCVERAKQFEQRD
jgi:hypothetical protein